MKTRVDFSAAADEAFLIALANTGHGTEDDQTAPDELRDVASVRAWWEAESGGEVTGRSGTSDDLVALRSARALVRALALRNNGVEVAVDTSALDGLPLRYDGSAGPGVAASGDSTLLRDLAARAALALIRQTAMPDARRFKACPGPDCGWVFRDRTRNGSRRWCDMAACGNRAKAAAFRERAR